MAVELTPWERQPDHGSRLTQAEYERRISALNASSPAMPTSDQEEALRQAEMSLLIDYHLGQDFPSARRARVLEEHRKLTRRFVWRLLGSVLTHPFSPSDGLARAQVRSFSKLLNDEELAALFDLGAEDVARLK
mgnify:CR=1 FL=1